MPAIQRLALLATILVSSSGGAQTSNWVSASSGEWTVASNWSNGVPTSVTNAVIQPANLIVSIGSGPVQAYLVNSLHTNSRIVINPSYGLTTITSISGSGPFDVLGTLRTIGGFQGTASDINLYNNGAVIFGNDTSSSVSHSGQIFADATRGSVEGSGSLALSSTSVLSGNFNRVSAFDLTNNGLINQVGGSLRVENVRNHGTILSDVGGSVRIVENTGIIRVDGFANYLEINGTHTGAQLGGSIEVTNGATLRYRGQLTLDGDFGFEAFTPTLWISGSIYGGNILGSAGKNFDGITFYNGTTFDTGLNLRNQSASFRYNPDFGSAGLNLDDAATVSVVASGTIRGGLISVEGDSRFSVSGTATLDSDMNIVDSRLVGGVLTVASGRTIEALRSTISANSGSVNNGTIRLTSPSSNLPAFANNGLIELLGGRQISTAMSSNAGLIRIIGEDTELTFTQLVSVPFVQNVETVAGGKANFRQVALNGSTFDHRTLSGVNRFGGFFNGNLLGSSSIESIPDNSFTLHNITMDEGISLDSRNFSFGNITSQGDIILTNGSSSFSNQNPVTINAPKVILRNHQSGNIPALTPITFNSNLDIKDSLFDPNGSTVTLSAGYAALLNNSTWGRVGSSESRTLFMNGSLEGIGQVVGDTRVSGRLAPGTAAALGELRFLGGKLTLQSGSTTAIDIASDYLFDTITVVGGQPVILGGSLEVNVLPGSWISPNQRFDILTTTSGYSGLFSNVVLPSGWQVVYESNRVGVQAVPEPASIAGLSIATLALLRRNKPTVPKR